jgi:hypothetical protein
MRSTRALTAIAVCLTAAIIAIVGVTYPGYGRSPQSLKATEQSNDRFVVHEWGTFTSFSGSDSVKLEFRPLVDADLPPFVLDRSRQAGISNLFRKTNLTVLQRMETPITYFYSGREREASVRVGFPQGLLTEFFPPVETLQPEVKLGSPQPISGAALDWGKIWIIPESKVQVNVANQQLAHSLRTRLCEGLLPATNGYDHYAVARETDSALVYVEHPKSEQRSAEATGSFFEKFLFYRGVGNFELPLKLAANADEHFELVNTSTDPIRLLFLITVDDKQLRYAKLDGIRPGQSLFLAQTKEASSLDQLAESMVSALIEEQLYEKEARAMVNTWRSSWFGEKGTRLLYILPRRITDELLPLEVQPVPDETLRVMVGRLEIMRPEVEAQVVALVKQSLHDRAAAEQRRAEAGGSESHALPAAILDLGRLAEPALVRVKNIAIENNVRHEATLLLRQLQQHREALAAATK